MFLLENCEWYVVRWYIQYVKKNSFDPVLSLVGAQVRIAVRTFVFDVSARVHAEGDQTATPETSNYTQDYTGDVSFFRWFWLGTGINFCSAMRANHVGWIGSNNWYYGCKDFWIFSQVVRRYVGCCWGNTPNCLCVCRGRCGWWPVRGWHWRSFTHFSSVFFKNKLLFISK